MSNSNSSKQILLSVIGVAILVIAVVGVSFAFYSYNRVGNKNTLKTGNISFNTTNTTIDMANVFPVSKSDILTDTINVGTGTVEISGNTSYNKGIDFTVTVEEVSESIGIGIGKLPISISVIPTALDGVKAYGSDEGKITINTYEDGNTISSGSILARGRIPANTNVNGVLTVRAYIDENNIIISDTYVKEENETKTVLTTEEWNNLSTNAAAFKIKVVANNGI